MKCPEKSVKDDGNFSTPVEITGRSVAVMTVVSGGLSSSFCDKGVQVSDCQRTDSYERITAGGLKSRDAERILWRQDSERSDSVRSADAQTSAGHSSRRSARRSSHRLRRSVSAREGEPVRVRPKVRRSISERGEHLNRHHRHHRRSSQRGSQRSRRMSDSGIGNLNRPPSQSNIKNNNVSSMKGNGRIAETVAVELGLVEAPGVSLKETRRRQIVFAVVLISLAILTASVLLVAITLFISPSADNVIRKENQEIYRVWSSTFTPQDGVQGAFFNQSLNTTERPG